MSKAGDRKRQGTRTNRSIIGGSIRTIMNYPGTGAIIGIADWDYSDTGAPSFGLCSGISVCFSARMAKAIQYASPHGQCCRSFVSLHVLGSGIFGSMTIKLQTSGILDIWSAVHNVWHGRRQFSDSVQPALFWHDFHGAFTSFYMYFFLLSRRSMAAVLATLTRAELQIDDERRN